MAHSNFVQSLERGMVIIDLVARSGSGLTLAELADALGVKRPTAFNLTRTLVSRRYLEKTSRPVRFTLGPGVLEAAEAWRHREVARQFEGLVRKISVAIPKATVVLAEPLGGEVVAVHLMDQNRPGVVQHSSSRRLAPYIHASTLCLHAFWPNADESAYEARHPFHEYGAGVWGTETNFRAFLDKTRKLGYVSWEAPNGRFLVGVPVFSGEGALLAAVGASVSTEQPRTDREKRAIVTLIREGVAGLQASAQAGLVSADTERNASAND